MWSAMPVAPLTATWSVGAMTVPPSCAFASSSRGATCVCGNCPSINERAISAAVAIGAPGRGAACGPPCGAVGRRASVMLRETR